MLKIINTFVKKIVLYCYEIVIHFVMAIFLFLFFSGLVFLLCANLYHRYIEREID